MMDSRPTVELTPPEPSRRSIRAAHARAALFAIAVGAVPGGASACDTQTTVRYIDPYVAFEPPQKVDVSGVAELSVGLYVEQLYEELTEGANIPLIHGFQGGVWLMPALRIRGIASPATVTMTLDVVGGSRLTDSKSQANFLLASDGWLEVQAFPVRVDYATWKIEELYGLDGVLEVTVSDEEGRTASVLLTLRLIEG